MRNEVEEQDRVESSIVETWFGLNGKLFVNAVLSCGLRLGFICSCSVVILHR
jgi:hypothetical protein